jgi:oligopeptide/dipeptide ABC transporter ATP-binding protein
MSLAMDAPLLSVENLKTHFHLREGRLKAVDGVSFQMNEGEILGMVGESGCGKSVCAHSLLRLVKTPPAQLSGRVLFRGTNLLEISKARMRRIRGRHISMIFQDPTVSLNPVLTVGRQISEALILHQGFSRSRAAARGKELLEMVGIPHPEKRYRQYAFQLSGGMRQRVMIAMALSCQPEILLADEPTTSLDVTIQAQILELIKEMNGRLGTAVLLITHDLGVVAGYTERVMVVYAGKIVETASTKTIFKHPWHPYTLGLMGAVPHMQENQEAYLVNIRGTPPSLIGLGEGCAFYARCDYADERCQKETPALSELETGHFVRCFNPEREEAAS